MARFIPNHIPRLPFRIPFFRIFYSTTYTVLYFITLVLLAVNPGTMLYTAFSQDAYQYVFEISGVYVLTILLTLFIYLSRLYTNRTVMAAVGKSWIPVEDGEVAKKVRKMIIRALERSAIIAMESRPRDLSAELSLVMTNSTNTSHGGSFVRHWVGKVLRVDPHNPPWGRIEHPGWSTPSRFDGYLAPHIQFRTVINELPNLFEAKAVSLAPPDLYPQPDFGEPPPADPAVVELLRRRPHSDLRSYLGHLSQLGLMKAEAGTDFLWQYERARFSSVPLSEVQFEDLMESFAILLTGMQELSPTIIGEARANRLAMDSSDTLSISGSSISSSSTARSGSIAGSVRQIRSGHSAGRVPSFYTVMTGVSYDTAPSAGYTRSPAALGSPSGRSEATFRPQTAVTHFSRTASTMQRQPSRETFDSVGSVIRTMPTVSDDASISGSSLRSRSLRSYAGSVIRHTPNSRGADGAGHTWVSPG